MVDAEGFAGARASRDTAMKSSSSSLSKPNAGDLGGFFDTGTGAAGTAPRVMDFMGDFTTLATLVKKFIMRDF